MYLLTNVPTTHLAFKEHTTKIKIKTMAYMPIHLYLILEKNVKNGQKDIQRCQVHSELKK